MSKLKLSTVFNYDRNTPIYSVLVQVLFNSKLTFPDMVLFYVKRTKV